MVDHDPVERRRGERVVIVREVGAGDEQRRPALEDARQRIPEGRDSRGRLAAHHQRHDRHRRTHAAQERQLQLQRVLADVRRRLVGDDRRRLEQRAGAGVVDRHDAERRLEAARAGDRHALEVHEVRRPDQHSHVEGPPAQLPVGERRHRARVHQAGMRRNERTDGREPAIGGSGARSRRRPDRHRPPGPEPPLCPDTTFPRPPPVELQSRSTYTLPPTGRDAPARPPPWILRSLSPAGPSIEWC